ncbi:MAG: hypothetical protein ACLPXT_09100 [Terracidiphilus sp.]
MPKPEVRATMPLTEVALPWTRLAGLTLSGVMMAEKITVFQYLMRLATSTEPSPVARS